MKKITTLFESFSDYQLDHDEAKNIKGGNGPTGIKKTGRRSTSILIKQ